MNLPHVTIPRTLNVLMEEDVDQLLGGFTTLMDILRKSLGVALKLLIL